MLSNQKTSERNPSNLKTRIKAYEEEITQLKNQLEQTQSQLNSWWMRCKIHRIQFMEVSQIKKAKPKDWENYLLGFGLATPKEGELWDIETLEVKGWILGKDLPIKTIEIFLNQKRLCEVSVDKSRLHIFERFKTIDYAKNCGFDFVVKNQDLLPENNDLEIIAILENQEKFKLFDINLKKRLTQSKDEEIKQPVFPLLIINHLKQNSDLFLRNPDPKFAITRHLVSENKGFLYCFIPKNACTTFKIVTSQYASDRVQAQLQKVKKASEIHKTQKILQANPEQLISDNYFKFTVIRNPFLRLVSAYLDKFLARGSADLPIYSKQFMLNCHHCQSSIMSFQEFVQGVENLPSQKLDVHWRPQVDFLLYNSYDMYLQFENLKQDIPKLEKALEIKVPKQNVAKHTTPYTNLDLSEPWKIPGEQLWELRQSKNAVPLPTQLYNDELIAKVRQRYQQDIELYENLFGVSPETKLR